jgi:hypothetical protein
MKPGRRVAGGAAGAVAQRRRGVYRDGMLRVSRILLLWSLSSSLVARAEDAPAAPAAAAAAPEAATTEPALPAVVEVSGGRAGFLGWHAAGEVHYTTTLDAAGKPAGVRVCRSRTDDVPAAWPAAITIGAGVACADVRDADVGGEAAAFAQREVADGKPLKASPWGLVVELTASTEGTTTTHTIRIVDGGSKGRALTLGRLAAPEALKLGEVLWRRDGAAVAVAVEGKGPGARRGIVVGEVGALLVGGAAGHKVAMAKEKDAAALLKKRDWSAAGRLLDEAIAADPAYAPVRYARAAAEAQGGIGRTAMIDNLAWLKAAAATDATAKKLLDGAKKDPAFDAWCGEPEVRELLGLPAVGTMDVPARLTERAATWTVQGATCRSPWLTLTFAAGKAGRDGRVAGTGTLEIAESCKGRKPKQKQPFAWAQSAAGPFVVTTRPVEVGEVRVPASSTVVLDDTHQQLKLQPDGGGDALGTFEPGRALIDDSVL